MNSTENRSYKSYISLIVLLVNFQSPFYGQVLDDSNFHETIELWYNQDTRKSIVNKFGEIEDWNTSKVTNMRKAFYRKGFNKDISKWDVSNVTNMSKMFEEAFYFDQDINNWDVSNVIDMSYMFSQAIFFNQNIEDWDVSKVNNMNNMFSSAHSFNQDLSKWNIKNVEDFNDFLFMTAMSYKHYDNLLENCYKLNLKYNIKFGAWPLQFCESEEERNHLIHYYRWEIDDWGQRKECELNSEKLLFYPNPVKDFLVIRNYDINQTIRIINSNGVKVLDSKINKKIDISMLANGMYVVMILDNSKSLVKTFKIIKN